MTIEPAWVTVALTLILFVVGLNAYFARSEINKNAISRKEFKEEMAEFKELIIAELKPNHGTSFADSVSMQFADVKGDIADLGEASARSEARHLANAGNIVTVGKEVASLKNLFVRYLIGRVDGLEAELLESKGDGATATATASVST